MGLEIVGFLLGLPWIPHQCLAANFEAGPNFETQSKILQVCLCISYIFLSSFVAVPRTSRALPTFGNARVQAFSALRRQYFGMSRSTCPCMAYIFLLCRIDLPVHVYQQGWLLTSSTHFFVTKFLCSIICQSC